VKTPYPVISGFKEKEQQVIALVKSGGGAGIGAEGSSSVEVENLTTELTEKNTQITDLTQKIESLEKEISENNTSKESEASTASALQIELGGLKTEFETVQRDLESKTVEASDLLKKLEAS
jgi:chromosome segregation ATPase